MGLAWLARVRQQQRGSEFGQLLWLPVRPLKRPQQLEGKQRLGRLPPQQLRPLMLLWLFQEPLKQLKLRRQPLRGRRRPCGLSDLHGKWMGRHCRPRRAGRTTRCWVSGENDRGGAAVRRSLRCCSHLL